MPSTHHILFATVGPDIEATQPTRADDDQRGLDIAQCLVDLDAPVIAGTNRVVIEEQVSLICFLGKTRMERPGFAFSIVAPVADEYRHERPPLPLTSKSM